MLKKSVLPILAAAALMLLTACNSIVGGPFTAAEVAAHNTRSDCWMIINDKVYDVTNYIDGHPGGDNILKGCGIDATTLFETQDGQGTHDNAARDLMQSFYIGDLAK